MAAHVFRAITLGKFMPEFQSYSGEEDLAIKRLIMEETKKMMEKGTEESSGRLALHETELLEEPAFDYILNILFVFNIVSRYYRTGFLEHFLQRILICK